MQNLFNHFIPTVIDQFITVRCRFNFYIRLVDLFINQILTIIVVSETKTHSDCLANVSKAF